MLGKLVTATARPLNAATGTTAVLVAVFGVLSAFNVGLTGEQQSALVVFFAVAGQWVVAITGSHTLSRIIGDPTIPSSEPGAPVLLPPVVPPAAPPIEASSETHTNTPAPGTGKHADGPWA